MHNFKKKNNVEVKLIEMHRADVKDTHGDNKKIKKALKRIKFSKFYKCLETTYEWYKKNNISKIQNVATRDINTSKDLNILKFLYKKFIIKI